LVNAKSSVQVESNCVEYKTGINTRVPQLKSENAAQNVSVACDLTRYYTGINRTPNVLDVASAKAMLRNFSANWQHANFKNTPK